MRIISCLASSIPEIQTNDSIYISQYSRPQNEKNGYFGLGYPTEIARKGISPSVETWDFATFALSIAAIDKLMPRGGSADGWTRVLDVEIHLCNPTIWFDQVPKLEGLLRFLTGDFWHLSFKAGGAQPPKPNHVVHYVADCISLLSGGIDSLIGGIDLTRENRIPIFVSHKVNGSVRAQFEYASKLNARGRFFQWSFEAKLDGYRENSTRGRSMVFFAFAAIAADAIMANRLEPVDIYIPENGFISLNIALSPARLGSYSTKTTHPIYMQGMQELWNHLGLPFVLHFPYRFKTKGEMMQECLDKILLVELLGSSVSCGKFIRNHKHCGVCIPCLVRRGAFLKNGWDDTTPGYKYDISTSNSDNMAVVTSAYSRMKSKGIRYVAGGALNFAEGHDKVEYEGVFLRGLTEVYELLHKYRRI
ncbi:hypothetical protein SDC9_72007 [bioreactor metagenome]|uniref:7-cyano-7-deazaguanine synthase n=1 Tax=bioreactor metagenome TaxID=1076179 RepID=A0A644YA63_9ZZZZ